MQIVIDIPEEKLNIIKNKIYCGIYDSDLYKAIAKGTPLSKAHDNKELNQILVEVDENDKRTER